MGRIIVSVGPLSLSNTPSPPPPPQHKTQLVPHEARDWAYELVSRYRHIFGEKDSCRIPSEEEMDRFLDT